MEQYFYLNENKEQVGPVSPDDFGRYGVTEHTMVWRKGMADWTKAGMLPELAPYFAAPTPPPFNNNTGANYVPNRPPRPDNYMVWAILTTLLCCLPFGICSIVFSSRVNSLYDRGNYDEAQEQAKKAKQWAIGGAIAGVGCCLIYVSIAWFTTSALLCAFA